MNSPITLSSSSTDFESEALVIVAGDSVNISGPDFELTLKENKPVLLPAGIYLFPQQQEVASGKWQVASGKWQVASGKVNGSSCKLIFITLSTDFISHLIEKYGALFENGFDACGHNVVDVEHLVTYSHH